MSRKKVCILVRNKLKKDPRVLRQVKWLAATGEYDITVVGFGDAGFKLAGADRTIAFKPPVETIKEKILKAIRLLLCNFSPEQAEKTYWSLPVVQEMYKAANGQYDIIHANDWDTLPIAFKIAAQSAGTRVIYDSHEMATAEFEDELWFTIFHRAYRSIIEKKYIRHADRVITVSPLIADMLSQLYIIARPAVIMNCPEWREMLPKQVDPSDIKLCYHGNIGKNRGIEELIRAVGLLEACYSLHLYLVYADINDLKAYVDLAKKVAPGKVFFNDPVSPDEIVKTINMYNIGVFAIQPVSRHNLAALPNKFFEYMAAGLCICISPIKAMSDIVERYECGVVAKGFKDIYLADAINKLSRDDILFYKNKSIQAATMFNSEVEGQKVLAIYRDLFTKKD